MNPLMIKANQMRNCFRKGKPVFGGHVFFSDPQITESMALHGYEFIWIDGEHSCFDRTQILHHIEACRSGGAASIVRIPWNDPVLAKPVLEMGPDGIIFPMVCSEKEARTVVDACCYPPIGQRGFGPRRAAQYGAISEKDYLENVNDSFLRIIQIEAYQSS